MTEADMIQILTTCHFDVRRHLCVPNVSWGLLPYEADLLVMSEAGFLTEVEVKISNADLKRDPVKAKFQRERSPLIKRMFYAITQEMWLSGVSPFDYMPEYAGLIVVKPRASRWTAVEVIRDAEANADVKKLDQSRRFQLARLGTLRYWSMRNAA